MVNHLLSLPLTFAQKIALDTESASVGHAFVILVTMAATVTLIHAFRHNYTSMLGNIMLNDI
jgi:hypothetical protein